MYYMMAQGVTVNHESLQAYTYNSIIYPNLVHQLASSVKSIIKYCYGTQCLDNDCILKITRTLP